MGRPPDLRSSSVGEVTVGTEEGYSELYERALRVAAATHRLQNRKGSALPYITHPVHVSVILLRHRFPTEVAVAGLLHDLVEDQGYELAEIEKRFGERVARIVAVLSEHKTDAQGMRRPWGVRKREALDRLREASREAAAVKAADTLHNVRCMALDVRRKGPDVWERFSRGPESQMDYYCKALRVARERLGDHPLVDELADAVEDLARVVGEIGLEDGTLGAI